MHSCWTVNEDYAIGENSNLLERWHCITSAKRPHAAIGFICRHKHPNSRGIGYAAYPRANRDYLHAAAGLGELRRAIRAES